MPKHKAKGGRHMKRGKKANEFKRELVLKEDGQEYGQVLKMLGNGRLSAYCFDGKTRICRIRGKMRKKVWVNQSDIILLSLRDFEDEKADVIMKYNPDEGRKLKKMDQLPDNVVIGQADAIEEQVELKEDQDEDFDFDEI